MIGTNYWMPLFIENLFTICINFVANVVCNLAIVEVVIIFLDRMYRKCFKNLFKTFTLKNCLRKNIIYQINVHNQKKIIFHAHCNLHKLLLLIRIIEFNVCMHVTLIKFIEYLELTVLD